MAKRRTTQLLAELKNLAKDAADNLYRRIAIAREVMSDLDWIATVHGGSDVRAADALQDEYFRDLKGFVSLKKLMDMHRDVSHEDWKSVSYGIAAVKAIHDEQLAGEKSTKHEVRTNWKVKCAEKDERIEDLERQVEQLLESNQKLRGENAELRSQIARLEGRIEEMDRRGELVSRVR